MNLQQRISVLVRLGEYMKSKNDNWQLVQEKASQENAWFTGEFIQLSVDNIVNCFLQEDKLTAFAEKYNLPAENIAPKSVGIVMAGNIPLVGFHDFLCGFLCGHKVVVKPSSKDATLIKHLLQLLQEWQPELKAFILLAEMLKGCDAYIATGSNNSARYFDYYFAKYPSIIRRNRTSVAVLTGQETAEELNKLADDICLYFGLGCRNISQVLVPDGYDFMPLLDALNKYHYFADHHKYKNNYDYQLSIRIINNLYYMTNGVVLLVENNSPFAPISTLNYRFYKDSDELQSFLSGNDDIQCIVGNGYIPFGEAQSPSLTAYADGVDTMQFLAREIIE